MIIDFISLLDDLSLGYNRFLVDFFLMFLFFISFFFILAMICCLRFCEIEWNLQQVFAACWPCGLLLKR